MPAQTTCPGCQHEYEVPASLLGKFVRCPRCRMEFRAPAPSDGAIADRVEPPPAPAVPVPQAEAPRPAELGRTTRRDPEDHSDRRSAGTRLLIGIAVVLLVALLSAIGYMVLLTERSTSSNSGSGANQPAWFAAAEAADRWEEDRAAAMQEMQAKREVLAARRVELDRFEEEFAKPPRPPVEVDRPDPGPLPRALEAVPAPPQDPPAPIELPRSKESGRALGKGAQRIDEGARIVKLDLASYNFEHCALLCWDTAGKTFYRLEQDGVLRRIALEGLKELRTLEIGSYCTFLATSAEGLVVTLRKRGEVWVIDPDTLEVQRRIFVPGVERAVCGRSSSVAFATGSAFNEVYLRALDLKAGKTITSYQERGQPTHLQDGDVTPDGKYLFRIDGSYLQRIRVDGVALSIEELMPVDGQLDTFELSVDSRWVCHHLSGVRGLRGHETTKVFSVGDLKQPSCKIRFGYLSVVTVEPKTGRIVAGQAKGSIGVYSPTGQREKDYNLTTPYAIAMHPAGGKMLCESGDEVFLLEVDAEREP
jgi:hypothetical protein